MKRIFSLLFAAVLLVLPVLAAEDPPDMDSMSYYGSLDLSGPIPVIVLPAEEEPQLPDQMPDEGYPMIYAAASGLDLDIDDTPPTNPLFYGAVYVTGIDSRLGTVTVYFPADYQSGVLGLDSSGYLISVASSSVTGYLAGVNNNRVSLATFSRPTYTQYSGSTTTSYTLSLRPVSSNADLITDSLPRYSFQQLYPYLILLMMGVLFVCCMRR